MPRELRALIDATVEASELSQTEKEELRRELESHILAHIYELELEGRTESEIINSIKSSFGDTEEIGKALFFAHRKLENIPWFGSFFYYKPLWYGFWIFLVHVVTWILYFQAQVLATFGRAVGPGAQGDMSDYWAIIAWELQQPKIALLLFGIAGLVVRAIILRRTEWKIYVEAIALSFVPFFMVGIVVILVGMQRDGIGLIRFIEWKDICYSIAFIVGLVIAGKRRYKIKLIKKNIV